MPLALVLGPANSAKAGEVLGAYTQAARRDALLVVPTAADVRHYERELVAAGATLGRIVTFPGLIAELAWRARHDRTRLTPLQRQRVLQRTLGSLRLPSLGASATGGGFARAAGRLIAELGQSRITPARFGAALRDWAGALPERSGYARELTAIYGRYVEALDELGRDDAERFAWGALDALRARPTLWGATPVFLYGFDDLTPIELDAVETLARQVGVAVTVSLTYEPDRPALAARAAIVEELRAWAQSVVQLPPLDDHYAAGSRLALHHLERHLFEPEPPLAEPGQAVVLMEAGGERAEAELVAAAVVAALQEGVAAAEIVVVCRSLARSGEPLERALERFGVAATSARRVPLAHTALGRALLALARYALLPPGERRLDDLLAYLRHPGVVDSADAVDRLEARLRRAGARLDGGGGWRASPGEPALDQALVAVEALRAAPDPAAALADSTRALLAAPFRERAQLLSGPQARDAAAATAVLDALAQLRELDAGRAPGGAELLELLGTLALPAHGSPSTGEVLVAEPFAIRARRFRRVFVTGLCEGEFPGPEAGASDPFLDDERRRELALASGLVLAQPGDPLERERYLLYACASRATERVSFSYRSSDEDGNLVLASPFLDDLAELFPGDWRERRRRRLLADVVWPVAEAPSERERELAVAFAEASRVDAAAGATGQRAGGPAATRILSERALAHVRHRNVVSAGALEAFAACPVKWLVERQLGLRGLDPDPDPMTRGSFIHALLERVFAGLEGPLTPATLASAQALLGAELGRLRAGAGSRAAGGGDDHVAAAFARLAPGQPRAVRAAIVRGIEAELRRYLRHEANEGCGWVPLRTELRFGLEGGDAAAALPPVPLGGGSNPILLSGIVDRVDADPRDDGRVIVRDYKSGAKRDTWPAARWLEDRQIQVALYMIAVQRLLEAHAVAGLYQPLAGDDLRPRGVYAAGVEVDRHAVPHDARSQQELDALLDQIEEQAVELAATLGRGELTPCPETCSPDGSCRYPGICWAER